MRTKLKILCMIITFIFVTQLTASLCSSSTVSAMSIKKETKPSGIQALKPPSGEEAKAKRAEAYYKEGYRLYTMKRYREAIAEYKKALRILPYMTKAYYWIAKCYYKLGDMDKSAWNCRRALQLVSDYKDPARLLKIIERRKEYLAATSKKTYVKETIPPPPIKEEKKVREEKSGLITIDLRDVEISHAMRMISKETGKNIVVSKDVDGRITISFSNVAFEEAFEAILEASNCIAVREGDIIKVLPSGEPPKIIHLPNGYINKTFTINYVSTDDLKETLIKFVPEITKVITTKGSKYIVVEGPPESVRKVEKLIKSIDTPPKQVMVEAKIIEVTHSDTGDLGMNLKWTNPNNPTEVLQTKGLAAPPTATGATGLYYSITNQNIEALVETLQTRTGYNLLSSPKVMTINEQEAEIITGSRLGYKVKTYTETGMIESVEFLDVGTKLVITPSIKSDGYMMMDIHPEISEGSIINELPQKRSTETTTKLIVKDGQTIIIGGLMKEYSQKVNKGIPFLMDIPLIGIPFRRVEIENEKKEIIILMSPHIITTKLIEEMEKPIKKFEEKFEKYETPMDLLK